MSYVRPQRVVVIGATGLIGSAVVANLTTSAGPGAYQVIPVTHETSPGLDLLRPRTMAAFFEEVGAIDHLVVAAGDARFGSLMELSDDALLVGVHSKQLGQVRVAMAALRHLPRGGSVTLTSGALAHDPIPGSAAVAMVNGALDSFVRAAAIDAPEGRRINAVSPGWIRETRLRMGLDPDGAASAREVARLYRFALESDVHGQVVSAQARAASRSTSDAA